MHRQIADTGLGVEGHDRLGECQEARYRRLLNSLQVGIFQTDGDGRFETTNPALARILGYESVEATRSLTFSVALFASRESYEQVQEKLNQNGSADDFDCELLSHSLLPVPVTLSVRRVISPCSGDLAIEGIIRDSRQQKGLESQLLQSQKMEALGHLAGGIAHDFNNLLTVIIGYATLMSTASALLPPDLSRDLEQILNAGYRASDLTGQLLTFSRKKAVALRAIDLNTVVRSMESMLRRVIGEDVDLSLVLTDAPTTVLADTTQLEQVLLNLIVNARDAMPLGGNLSISTRLDDSNVTPAPAMTCGPYAVLTVRDTGCGMESKVLDRIFDPFFTTKSAGKGTGLGLSTVYGIVRHSGGHVSVESKPGMGTSLHVFLPHSHSIPAAKAAPKATYSRREFGSQTILIAEDEPAVRSFLHRVLSENGFEVLVPSDPLRFSRETKKSVDLLITDVVMPGLSGRELAEELTRMQPALRVLYITGYTDDSVIRRGVQQGKHALIYKPFGPVELLSMVRDVLMLK